MRRTLDNIIVLTLALIFYVIPAAPLRAKDPDLAGRWYDSSPAALRRELENLLDSADVPAPEGRVIGMIAPHAGLKYSGSIAARGYKVFERSRPELVILVGFTHRRSYPGRIAVLTDDFYRTPLGAVAIDSDMTERFLRREEFADIPSAFTGENSIEMQIPFIQAALNGSRLVVLAAGDQARSTSGSLADALYDILRGRKGFVVIASTDMCHYLPYAQAVARDSGTIKELKKMDPDALYSASLKSGHRLMCGYGVVTAVMEACKRLGATRLKVLGYANSGDTSGRRDSVVGYLSAAFTGPGPREGNGIPAEQKGAEMLNDRQKKELLGLARTSIENYLRDGRRIPPETGDEDLEREMGAFVTLHKGGRLRGCIGNMVAKGPLDRTVCDMAIAAAVEDPRFPPVSMEELDDIDIEISVLSPMVKTGDPDSIEAGKHGVMVRDGWRSGVYLPQVAREAGWGREEFMNSLCANKAGMAPDAWKTGACDIYVFTAEVFGEKELR
jgi:hypothetical protein